MDKSNNFNNNQSNSFGLNSSNHYNSREKDETNEFLDNIINDNQSLNKGKNEDNFEDDFDN